MPLVLDHIAVACTSLAEGTAWVEQTLGVTMQPGGQHARYGTHNTLLGLADGLYFEVIAIDPDATPEAGHSWFGLDHFIGPPCLANWICRTDDLAKEMRKAPAEVGSPRDLARADLSWQITVPDDGSLPFGGGFPTLIEWATGTVHPAQRLPQSGCRLLSLDVAHPQAEMLAAHMDLQDTRVSLRTGDFELRATFQTPQGTRAMT